MAYSKMRTIAMAGAGVGSAFLGWKLWKSSEIAARTGLYVTGRRF